MKVFDNYIISYSLIYLDLILLDFLNYRLNTRYSNNENTSLSINY